MNIRYITPNDKDDILEMMIDFYNSPATIEKAPEHILRKDIDDCLSDLPFIDGFIFEDENKNKAGYAMVAKSYSTGCGGICIWFEDIYLKEDYQGKGFTTQFFKYIEDLYNKVYPNNVVRYRMEVEKSNINAIKSYEKNGFKALSYLEMTKEI